MTSQKNIIVHKAAADEPSNTHLNERKVSPYSNSDTLDAASVLKQILRDNDMFLNRYKASMRPKVHKGKI